MSDTVELKYDGRSYEMSAAQLRTTNIGLVAIWSKYNVLRANSKLYVADSSYNHVSTNTNVV